MTMYVEKVCFGAKNRNFDGGEDKDKESTKATGCLLYIRFFFPCDFVLCHLLSFGWQGVYVRRSCRTIFTADPSSRRGPPPNITPHSPFPQLQQSPLSLSLTSAQLFLHFFVTRFASKENCKLGQRYAQLLWIFNDPFLSSRNLDIQLFYHLIIVRGQPSLNHRELTMS